MTMNPVELDRKVRQLDNEVQSIYEMLAAIQGTQGRHTNRFREVAEQLEGIDQRLTAQVDAVDQTLTTRLDGLDAKVDAVDQTLTARLDGLDAKVDTVIEMLRAGPPGSA